MEEYLVQELGFYNIPEIDKWTLLCMGNKAVLLVL